MSQTSRYKSSRDHWKKIAIERGGELRYERKEARRFKRERDTLKQELKEARLRAQESVNQGLVIQNKVDLVHLALLLFSVARIGFRAVYRVLDVLAPALGIKKVPCVQTVINWVTRLSLVRIESACQVKDLAPQSVPFSNGLIWMIDISIGLGTGKILTVLALRAHHHQSVAEAPGFEHVHCIGVSVAASWTGESIAGLLRRLIGVMGRPVAYLKDGGTDLHKATGLLIEQRLGSACIEDISHFIANIFKYWYGDHPCFETFVSACGRVSGKLKQTLLACLVPPKVHTKARFMNVHRLIAWADRLLALSPPGRASKGSVLAKLRASLDKLPSCRAFIKRFRDDAVPLLKCQKIFKSQGLSLSTLEQCEPLIQSIVTQGVRTDFRAYLQRQLEIATALGLEKIGMPISSDPEESLYGLGKQHGTGEVMDADRIALRLPALCGPPPSLEEARQVLEISVARQREITDSFTSLTKQRREVLKHPERLESLSAAHGHVELIPSAKSRSKNPEIVD